MPARKPKRTKSSKASLPAVAPRTDGQAHYLDVLKTHDIIFGVGPAGSGKTYMAVAHAVDLLKSESITRIVLTRPVVEAGEKLGHLPGDIAAKVDPYLRPLYDALNEMLGAEQVAKLIEAKVIELAPLAYMRGRTLNQSAIILDEAQNVSPTQMKMFLTRMGIGSKVMVTGDVTQIDLPKGNPSGLPDALDRLKSVEGVGIVHLTAEDVVRHPMVRKVIAAYER